MRCSITAKSTHEPQTFASQPCKKPTPAPHGPPCQSCFSKQHPVERGRDAPTAFHGHLRYRERSVFRQMLAGFLHGDTMLPLRLMLPSARCSSQALRALKTHCSCLPESSSVFTAVTDSSRRLAVPQHISNTLLSNELQDLKGCSKDSCLCLPSPRNGKGGSFVWIDSRSVSIISL